MRGKIASGALALTLAAATVAGRAHAATIKTVALQNDPSPRAPYLYRRFREVAVSDAVGQHVAVIAQLRGTRCLFKLDPDGVVPGATAACRHDPTPDALVFGNPGGPSIDVAGDVAFAAPVNPGRSGVFRSDPTFVATTGDPAPAPATGSLERFVFGRLSDTGDVAFEATIDGGALVGGVRVDQGLFLCSGGNGNCSAANGGTGVLGRLALVNDAVPDRPGREFCSFAQLDASTFGIAFRASTQLDCADTAEPPAVGVFRKPAGGPIETLALQGEAANPNPSPGGTVYVLPQPPAISNTGVVAFVSAVTGSTTTAAIYRCTPGICPASPAQAAVSPGDTDVDGNVLINLETPEVSDAGDIAFHARVAPPSAHKVEALYIKRAAGSLDRIVLVGDVVPGSSPVATFRGLGQPSASPAGKVAFVGRIRRGTPPQLHGVFVFE